MKKILIAFIFASIIVPAFAVTDVSKEEAKYQAKIEKIRRKQEIQRLKHPEKFNTPVQEQNLTLGIVQKDIKIGTPQSEVALALGSPNIVTRDADGKDTWIYDKMASVTSYNNSGFSIGVNGFGGGGSIGSNGLGGGGGILGTSYGSNKGGVQTNRKTLTVVIKFDKTNKVESFNYHMSSF